MGETLFEEQLGFRLFARRGPRMSPTAAGRERLGEGRWLLRPAANLESRLRRIVTGDESELRPVRDSFLPTAALVQAIRAFEAKDRGTRLRIGPEVITASRDARRQGRADLALAVGDPPPGLAHRARRLRAIDFVLRVAPRHPLARADHPPAREDLLTDMAIVLAGRVDTGPHRS